MVTGVYIWFSYTKPSGSNASRIDWTGKIDTDKAKKVIDRIKTDDMLKVQRCSYFTHDVTLSISMQEIATGNVIYRRTVKTL